MLRSRHQNSPLISTANANGFKHCLRFEEEVANLKDSRDQLIEDIRFFLFLLRDPLTSLALPRALAKVQGLAVNYY